LDDSSTFETHVKSWWGELGELLKGEIVKSRFPFHTLLFLVYMYWVFALAPAYYAIFPSV
jgi:hypothetical protein